MHKFHYFINYKPVTPPSNIGEDTLLNALAGFQFWRSNHVEATFTVLDEERGLAFSQTYRKIGDGKASHGAMYKHEPGVTNPDGSSFDSLLEDGIKFRTTTRACIAQWCGEYVVLWDKESMRDPIVQENVHPSHTLIERLVNESKKLGYSIENIRDGRIWL